MADDTAVEDNRRPGRRWTGLTILLALLGFFGVVFAVNGVMIFAALSTRTGTDTDSAYQAGRMFEHDVALAKAQDARRWQVDAKVTPAPDGGRRVDVVARDASGKPIGGMVLSAIFERPTDRRLDRAVVVTEDSPGTFHGTAAIPAGQWDLVIELTRQGDQMFRSRNRIILK
jgi:nitrogen fixation protein FixH